MKIIKNKIFPLLCKLEKKYFDKFYPPKPKIFVTHKKISLIIILLLISTLAHAEVSIYCPECKEHIYDYQADTLPEGRVVKAKDFKSSQESIIQPTENDSMTCPLCNIYFEGYDYMCYKNDLARPTKYFPAFTFLTKEDGKFVWKPYEMNIE